MTSERLTDEDIRILVLALNANSYVTAVDLRYNRITDIGADYIAEFLKVICFKDVCVMLCQAFLGHSFSLFPPQTNTAIRELNLLSNDIEEAGGTALARVLEVNFCDVPNLLFSAVLFY